MCIRDRPHGDHRRGTTEARATIVGNREGPGRKLSTHHWGDLGNRVAVWLGSGDTHESQNLELDAVSSHPVASRGRIVAPIGGPSTAHEQKKLVLRSVENRSPRRTRRARSLSFSRVFSVISVPPWLIFISMGRPQAHETLKMTTGRSADACAEC